MIDSPKALANAFRDAEWVAYDELNPGDEVISVSHVETINQFIVRTLTVKEISPAMFTHQVVDTEGVAHNQNSSVFYRVKPKLPTKEGSVIVKPVVHGYDLVTGTLVKGSWRCVTSKGAGVNIHPENITSFEKELK